MVTVLVGQFRFVQTRKQQQADSSHQPSHYFLNIFLCVSASIWGTFSTAPLPEAFCATPRSFSGGSSIVCPAQTPSRNIHKKMQKQTTPTPMTPLRVSSNLIFFTGGFRRVAMECSAYIFSGAERPATVNPFRKTLSRPVMRQSRAWLRAISSVITLCLL